MVQERQIFDSYSAASLRITFALQTIQIRRGVEHFDGLFFLILISRDLPVFASVTRIRICFGFLRGAKTNEEPSNEDKWYLPMASKDQGGSKIPPRQSQFCPRR